jgi:uncharacterized lipoprotein
MIKIFPLLLFLSYILGGCAFTPQAVVLNPSLYLSSSSIGNNKTVWLNVVDERTKSTLGTRGARGVGAEITIQGDLVEIVGKALAEGLSSQGFQVSKTSAEIERELRVELRSLEYRTIVGFWSGTVKTESAMKGICILNKSRPYEKLYRGENNQSVQVVQSAESNNVYINNALSSSINKMLADQVLLQCLAQ